MREGHVLVTPDTVLQNAKADKATGELSNKALEGCKVSRVKDVRGRIPQLGQVWTIVAQHAAQHRVGPAQGFRESRERARLDVVKRVRGPLLVAKRLGLVARVFSATQPAWLVRDDVTVGARETKAIVRNRVPERVPKPPRHVRVARRARRNLLDVGARIG